MSMSKTAFGTAWRHGLAVSAAIGTSIPPVSPFAQLRKAQAQLASPGRRQLDLAVKFIGNGIYNPATDRASGV